MNGTTPFEVFEIHTFFAIELMTKTFMPTGGVIKPVSTTIRKIARRLAGAKQRFDEPVNAHVAIDIGEQTGGLGAGRSRFR